MKFSLSIQNGVDGAPVRHEGHGGGIAGHKMAEILG